MTGKQAKIYFNEFGFTEYESKGMGGVRTYTNGSIILTAFMLTNNCFMALPVSANLTIQTPHFDFVKEKDKINEYLAEYRKVTNRFNITIAITA
jgi:hypothetical protein